MTGRHVLQGLLVLSVVSCFALPRGLDRPRELFAPLLAPMSHSGIYVCDAIGRNINDLLHDDCDEQAVRAILRANAPLRDHLLGEIDRSLLRRLEACEQLIAAQQKQLDAVSRAREALGGAFPCKLIPGKVIGEGATPWDREALLRTSSRPTPGAPVTTRALLINRPTAVPEGIAALSESALVGRIVSSGAWTAHLQLITDPDFSARGLIVRLIYPDRERLITVEQRDGSRTLLVQRPLRMGDAPIPVSLFGDGRGLVTAAVPARHAIEPGDWVITSDRDGWLPMSVRIGTVRAVEPLTDNPKHVALRIEPEANLDALRRVTIVQPLAREGR
ncbi:MAG: rod shape-determining protein MreC [Planctomycetota bacterium]